MTDREGESAAVRPKRFTILIIVRRRGPLPQNPQNRHRNQNDSQLDKLGKKLLRRLSELPHRRGQQRNAGHRNGAPIAEWFRSTLPLKNPDGDDRQQKKREQCRERHCERLRVREGIEKPRLAVLEKEDGEE